MAIGGRPSVGMGAGRETRAKREAAVVIPG